jgi:hypothetical protein
VWPMADGRDSWVGCAALYGGNRIDGGIKNMCSALEDIFLDSEAAIRGGRKKPVGVVSERSASKSLNRW